MADINDWQAAADKEVKGRDLTWNTPEGIAVKPLYTAEDVTVDPGLPGYAPFMVIDTLIWSSGIPANSVRMS